MFRGEIFVYPLYLQKQLASQNVQFFCSDVVCKYWPYLQRVVGHCPELPDLLNMRPFLSIMHAKAHSWMCEVMIANGFYFSLLLLVLFQPPVFQMVTYKFVVVAMGRTKSRGSRNNDRGGGWTGEQLPLSRAAICSKYMSKAGKYCLDESKLYSFWFPCLICIVY